MISMTKDQILKELENVYRWGRDVAFYSDMPAIQVSTIALSLESIRVYRIISNLRYLSYYEDAFLDMINNADLNFDDLKNRIFVNKDDVNKFSNKQIIKFIRNAFLHSDGNKELYRISKNGRFLEVDLKNTKPIPFHVKMDISDLEELIMSLRTVSSVFYLSLIEGNKVKRVYLKNKIDSNIFIDIIGKYYYEYIYFDYKKYGRFVLKYLDEHNISYEIKEYNLMNEQISLIDKNDNIINNAKSNNAKSLYNCFMTKIISMIIPLEEEKLSIKEDNMLFLKLLCDYPFNSFNSLEKEFENIVFDLQKHNELNDIQKRIYECTGPRLERLLLYSQRDFLIDLTMECIIYYITTVSKDDKLTIGGREYGREFIRNSFAHGRWFIDENNYIVLCDCRNGKNNDYEFHTIEKMSLNDLFNMIYNKQYGNENIRVLRRN